MKSKNHLFYRYLMLIIFFAAPTKESRGDVFVSHVRATKEEFALEVQKNPDSHLAFIDYYQEIFPSPRQAQQLHKDLARAEKAFIEESLATASQLFSNLVQKSFDADWKASERALLFHSHLRWAQLADNSNQQRLRLSQAIRFDPFLLPSAETFPPDLLASLSQARNLLLPHFVDWSPQAHHTPFHRLLINGRSYEVAGDRSIRILDGPMRVTWLSNTFQPHTQMISKISELNDKLPLRPMIEGECFSPLASAYLISILQSFVALFANQCQRKYNRNQWDHHLLLGSHEMEAPFHANPNTFVPPPSLPKSETHSLWSSPWTWVGVASAATLIYQYSNNRGPSTTQSGTAMVTPTHY